MSNKSKTIIQEQTFDMQNVHKNSCQGNFYRKLTGHQHFLFLNVIKLYDILLWLMSKIHFNKALISQTSTKYKK